MEDITPADSEIPIYLIPLTEEELVERNTLVADAIEREAAEQAKIDAKQSALSKLALLGLTEEEAKAVIGL